MVRFLKYMLILVFTALLVKVVFRPGNNLTLYIIAFAPFIAMGSAMTETRYRRNKHYDGNDYFSQLKSYAEVALGAFTLVVLLLVNLVHHAFAYLSKSERMKCMHSRLTVWAKAEKAVCTVVGATTSTLACQSTTA